jgi:hypothetical protein
MTMTKYPELNAVVEPIADCACALINRLTRDIQSEMPYRAQWVLEEVIKQLQKRV